MEFNITLSSVPHRTLVHTTDKWLSQLDTHNGFVLGKRFLCRKTTTHSQCNGMANQKNSFIQKTFNNYLSSWNSNIPTYSLLLVHSVILFPIKELRNHRFGGFRHTPQNWKKWDFKQIDFVRNEHLKNQSTTRIVESWKCFRVWKRCWQFFNTSKTEWYLEYFIKNNYHRSVSVCAYRVASSRFRSIGEWLP